MENKILLGNISNPMNDIKVNDPTVSRNHLQVTYIDDQRLLVEDLDSLNGTYINNRNIRIKKKEIGVADEILVGNYKFTGAEILNELKKKIKGEKFEFYSEFAALESKFTDRKKALKNLNRDYHARTIVARITIVIVFVVLYLIIIKDMIPDTMAEMGLVIIILSSGIAALLVEKLFSKDELAEKRNQINEEYENILVCPKCDTYLGARSYASWRRKRKCHACNALWV